MNQLQSSATGSDSFGFFLIPLKRNPLIFKQNVDCSHFLLPASAAGSDNCARLAELWCHGTSCRIVPVVGESLSQVGLITRLMKAVTWTSFLAAFHDWLGG